jgi:hypothetical protein
MHGAATRKSRRGPRVTLLGDRRAGESPARFTGMKIKSNVKAGIVIVLKPAAP